MKRLFLLFAVLGLTLASCENDAPAPDDNQEQPQPDPEPDPEPDPKPDPELPQNYVKYGDVVRELKSMYYIINDAEDLGYQYAMAMTPTEGVATFDDIIYGEEYLFLSFEEGMLFDAIESNDGRIDVMTIDKEDVVYMFVAKLGELDIEDSNTNRLMVSAGEVVVAYDETNYSISVDAHYQTINGDTIDVVATLPFEEPAEPVLDDSYYRYMWGDINVDASVGSAYVEDTPAGVTYTICKDAIKTYVYYEDTPFLKVVVAGKMCGEDFEIDVATFDGEFSIWACDPIKGMDLRVSNDNRTGRTGVVSVENGVLKCEGLAYNDISVDVCFVGEYRTVNECVNISYDERTELFTPRSVVLDNSGENEYKIYVSSKSGITTVKDMIKPEIVVTYPKEGWEKWLMNGNFISGSSYPEMTFKYMKSTYKKGEGDCYGMNAQIPEYDVASGRLRLNLNLYTEEGGMALYYSGEFTLVE